ncbi:MAG: FAD-dependent oxidoreductase [Proteobacteria bacterium]|nr:FAD-dependent oxidoreductase [Pseudomonadota bacterium]
MPLYLTKLQLQAELNRCLGCKAKPCMNACPVNCNPHDFIQFAKENDWQNAVGAIVLNNPMGQTCGLICPDKFCMKACTRRNVDFPINIPRVQATILNTWRNEKTHVLKPLNGKRIAIIGAGPAGIAAAACLIPEGYYVEIFESRHEIGGALNMIPRERLPHEVIERDWSFIFEPDRILLHLNSRIENPAELLDKFDGVIVSTGEPNCVSLRIPGEELSVSYMDYLYEPEKYRTDGAVAVIGGGNVAVDCALTAQRMGSSSVEMFIRRRIADMRVSKAEYLELIDHKIDLSGMTSPEKIEAHGELKTLWVRRNIFDGERWHGLENSSIPLPYFSLIIRAIGSRADEKTENCDRLIYAGDCKTGGSTIVEAIASGRTAAAELMKLVMCNQ